MKEKFEDDYLNKKLEPKKITLFGAEKFPEPQIADYEEFGEHNYLAPEGKFEFKMGDTNISLEYGTPHMNEIIGTKDSLFKINLPLFLTVDALKEDEKFKPWFKMFENMRILENVTLDNGKDVLDTSKIFSDQNGKKKIYFNADQKLLGPSGIEQKDPKIVLTEDPLTPKGLLFLLHEIGHYESDQLYSAEDNKERIEQVLRLYEFVRDSSTPIDEASAKTSLENERAAWTHALNNLRPFTKDLQFNRKGIDHFVHKVALQSYSETIRRAVKKEDPFILVVQDIKEGFPEK